MSARSPIIGISVAALAFVTGAASALAECKTMGFTVNDYGKDGPTKDAKDLLDKEIAKWAADNGVQKYTVGKKNVKCELFLDLLLFDEHTCTATASVCWGAGAAAPAKTADEATKKKSAKTADEGAVKKDDATKAAASDKKVLDDDKPPVETGAIEQQTEAPAAKVDAPPVEVEKPASAAATPASDSDAAERAAAAAERAAAAAERAAAAAEKAAAANAVSADNTAPKASDSGARSIAPATETAKP